MPAHLLIRLDDACPSHHRQRWQRMEDLLDSHGLRPLVAVIPDCQDPDLLVHTQDADFWTRAQNWQAKGWSLSLHGCTHQFQTRRGGLVPLNRYSEFAGVPKETQRTKIIQGMEILGKNNLDIQAWVAPAHSFDRTTLAVLSEETKIRLISDGLAVRPFFRFGFVWIPQQMWRPRRMKKGVWTLCLHPNEMQDTEFDRLDLFIRQNPDLFAGKMADWTWLIASSKLAPQSANFPRWTVFDGLFALGFLSLRGLRNITKALILRARSGSRTPKDTP